MKKNEIIALSTAIIILVVMFAALNMLGLVDFSSKVTTAAAIEIIISFALVLITAVYVKRTADIAQAGKKQADGAAEQTKASLEMAREMKAQRYDAVRPVLDIQPRHEPNDWIAEGLAALKDDMTRGLTCRLHNIGIGPALDVNSFVPNRVDRKYFGTLAFGASSGDLNLSIVDGEHGAGRLVAHYADVYGRIFESFREVSSGGKKGWEIGPLQVSERGAEK